MLRLRRPYARLSRGEGGDAGGSWTVSRFLRKKEIESPLAPFARFVESSALARLQEEYVATFDFNPAVALYLGHHLFGDNQNKGAYLIRLKQEFGRQGFTPSGNELPDHLPLVLGFLAYLARNVDAEVRRSFISEWVLPGVERLSAAFPIVRIPPGSRSSRRQSSCAPWTLQFRRRENHAECLHIHRSPYAAMVLFLFVTPYRYFSNRLTWSAYSTQFLEGKALYWGSNPWHYGIIPVLIAHLVSVIAPGPMRAILGNQRALILLEDVGQGLGLLALFGCLVLLIRRLRAPILKTVTSASDWVLLVLLIVEVATGVYMGIFIRGGPLWYLYTAVPYFHSLLAFDPQIGTWPTSPWCSNCTRRGRF